MPRAPMIPGLPVPNVAPRWIDEYARRVRRSSPDHTGQLKVLIMQTQDPRQARDYFAQKLAFVTGPFELEGQIKRQEAISVVDVRLPSDFAAGHIPGAINLPQGKWHTLAGLSKDRTAVIYCYSQTCKLAAAAAVEFASAGIAVVEMEGGFEAWQKSNLPIEKLGAVS
jgi:rhodanese-related sulfurtransferase